MIKDIDILRNTIELAHNVRVEYNKNHPDGEKVDLSDISDILNPTENEQKLYDFLNKQNLYVLQRMISIMYLGRDKDYELKEDAEKTISYVYELLKDNFGWNDKEILIDQMTGKMDFDLYLQDGIKILNSIY